MRVNLYMKYKAPLSISLLEYHINAEAVVVLRFRFFVLEFDVANAFAI